MDRDVTHSAHLLPWKLGMLFDLSYARLRLAG
jgi:hypothetical protein